MSAAVTLSAQVGIEPACEALGVPRSTFYRRHRSEPSTPGREQPRAPSARALSAEERETVHAVLCEPRFVDRAPAEVVATLLDEGTYHCSERTMYRILAAHAPVRERRAQAQHPAYSKPELLATGPHQVWSWDITRLLGPEKWTYYYLYVLLDIFSRYAVGWLVADRESAQLAGRLIEETCQRQGVCPAILTLHSDRGAPMTSKCTAQLLADLGVTQSLSRPQVSDDNPYSEAQFKTLKYHPTFPSRFASCDEATRFCRGFFRWYNAEHRHGGIALLTPEDVHYGRAARVIGQRQAVLEAAYEAHPERFPNGRPTVPTLPSTVWINPPAVDHHGTTVEGQRVPAAHSPPSPTSSEPPAVGAGADGPRTCAAAHSPPSPTSSEPSVVGTDADGPSIAAGAAHGDDATPAFDPTSPKVRRGQRVVRGNGALRADLEAVHARLNDELAAARTDDWCAATMPHRADRHRVHARPNQH